MTDDTEQLVFTKRIIEVREGDRRLLYLLQGPKGAVQLVAYVLLPDSPMMKVIGDNAGGLWDAYPVDGGFLMPLDLGYHSPVFMYAGQEPLEQACEWLDGEPCYYDGSTPNAERLFRDWNERGQDDSHIEYILTLFYRGTFGERTDSDI